MLSLSCRFFGFVSRTGFAPLDVCSMYADLCARIARTPIAGLGEDATGKDASKGSKKFRKMLLVKVQQEFEKDWQGLFAAVQV